MYFVKVIIVFYIGGLVSGRTLFDIRDIENKTEESHPKVNHTRDDEYVNQDAPKIEGIRGRSRRKFDVDNYLMKLKKKWPIVKYDHIQFHQWRKIMEGRAARGVRFSSSK